MSSMGIADLLVTTAILFVICYGGIRMIFPLLKETPAAQAQNYAGRTVAYGLGLVWVFFAFALCLLGLIFDDQLWKLTPLVQTPVIILVLVCFALGLVDDSYGTGASRGFKGHLKALAKGKLTTGGLKLFGISAVAFYCAFSLEPLIMLTSAGPQRGILALFSSSLASKILYGLFAGAGIALTSNFLNLCDLRPGRALKAYGLLTALAGVLMIFTFSFSAMALSLIILIVPLIAVFGLDVKEQGMLGDTGANPFGALVGCAIIFALGTNYLMLGVYVAVMLALNFASEKVSFSRVISGNKFLSKLDNLGRLDKGKEK